MKRNAIWDIFKIACIVAGTLYATTFIILNSLENVLAKDLPGARSIQLYSSNDQAHTFLNKIGINPALELDTTLGNIGNIETMRFPRFQESIRVNPALIAEDGHFLIRKNYAHTLIIPSSDEGVARIIVYAQSFSSPLESVDGLRVGDNIFLETSRGWHLHYRLEDIDVVEGTNDFILRDGSMDGKLGLILSIDDAHALVAVAKFVAVVSPE